MSALEQIIPPRVGIIGHRSWIAAHLQRHLETLGVGVQLHEKSLVDEADYSKLDALFLIAGRARPTRDELSREERLVESVSKHPRRPRRLVYLSSSSVDKWERESRPLSPAGEAYVLTKRRCESLALGHYQSGFVVRAPAVFGAGQPIESEMLVPTIARSRVWLEPLVLHNPLEPFEMIHVAQLARVMAEVGLVESAFLMPVTSIRTSTPVSPLDVVGLAAPGIPVSIPRGWSHPGRFRQEPTARHVREVRLAHSDSDILATMQWYESEYGMRRLGDERRELALASGPDDFIDI